MADPLAGLTQVASSALSATLSTVYPYANWQASKCSDGTIDPPNCGSWCLSHCATDHQQCTQANPCNWLALALPASTSVGKVAVYNRRDSYPNIPNIQSWLGELEVWLGTAAGSTDGIKCGTASFDAAHEPAPYVRTRTRHRTAANSFAPFPLAPLRPASRLSRVSALPLASRRRDPIPLDDPSTLRRLTFTLLSGFRLRRRHKCFPHRQADEV